MLSLLLTGKHICMYHLYIFASKWDLVEYDTQEEYATRFIQILNIIDDSEDLGLAV
jgi:hypothetical protein